MNKRHLLGGLTACALAVAGLTGPATAQDVTLRLHQFLPPQSTIPAQILRPWSQAVSDASDGRIEIQHFDSMALGGRPPELFDQARDGVVDLAMTLVGYTSGRFPRSEVFELPFMMTDPEATARAFWSMMQSDFQKTEFADVQVLGAWVHGPGQIHTADGVERLEDMQGKTLRGPTRVITDLLGELGAEPVGMPLPVIPEALSKGVINGTAVPWEVTPSIRLSELVDHHTEFGGTEALYTATIVLVMNKARYDALPEDLRAAIDSVSGAELSGMASRVMLAADVPAREIAVAAGNTIVTLDDAEIARWKAAAQPVIDRWVAEMDAKGLNGQDLIDRARALIAENGG